MKLTKAIASMDRGAAIFANEVDAAALQTLNGMVANSELCKCEHGEFTWYFAWTQKDTESEADKASQMVAAIRG